MQIWHNRPKEKYSENFLLTFFLYLKRNWEGIYHLLTSVLFSLLCEENVMPRVAIPYCDNEDGRAEVPELLIYPT